MAIFRVSWGNLEISYRFFYILHKFITGNGIVTSFLHYAELIVKNYMFHSTLAASVLQHKLPLLQSLVHTKLQV